MVLLPNDLVALSVLHTLATKQKKRFTVNDSWTGGIRHFQIHFYHLTLSQRHGKSCSFVSHRATLSDLRLCVHCQYFDGVVFSQVVQQSQSHATLFELLIATLPLSLKQYSKNVRYEECQWSKRLWSELGKEPRKFVFLIMNYYRSSYPDYDNPIENSYRFPQ